MKLLSGENYGHWTTSDCALRFEARRGAAGVSDSLFE